MLIGQTIGSGEYRFEIEQELGSGAMGTVYRAKFYQGEKLVPAIALKVVALGLLGNEGAMARFTREANILKQLRHPHIVRLYATGHYRKTPFIAMEYIDGEALDRILARRGRLSWEEVANYGKQLCNALQYAHEKGIIHRDLKPSNLMITRDDVLKLTDFGIAKDTDVTALTGANSTIGTAAYMSPEQCKGDKNLSHKSDLYSLGIVFFELLTGKKPFYADTTVDMFLKHVNEPPPRIGKLLADLPAKFESIILQLLEKDKEDRPIDAAWVARMLTEIEDDAFARKSAGLDVASARKIDRRHDPDAPTLDAADREAARALRGEKKKKKKKKSIPWHQQAWLKAAGIITLLVAMAGGVYFAFLRPDSPAKMFAAIESAKTPDEKVEAAAAYLKTYGDKPGEQTDAAVTIFREGRIRKRERQLATRFHAKMSKPEENDDKEAYEYTWQAIQYEHDGNLKTAAEMWNRVKSRFPDEGKLPYTLDEVVLAKALWTWVAEKRLRDIQSVDEQVNKLNTRIAENRRFERPTTYDPANPESEATRALRLERFGDWDKAARTWALLREQTEKEPDQHVWFLMACERRPNASRQTPENAIIHRQNLVRSQITAADAKVKVLKSEADRIGVRIQCRDIEELYDDEKDPVVVDAVERAGKLRKQLSKS